MSLTKKNEIINAAEEKVRNCFLDLTKKLEKSNQSLYDFFCQHTKAKKGRLTKSEF